MQVVEYLSTGGPPAWYKAKQRERAQRERQEARRRRRRVVVVGAGPAGLTAALHLKVGSAEKGPGGGRGRRALGCAGCAGRDTCGQARRVYVHFTCYTDQWMFHQARNRTLSMPGYEFGRCCTV